jgi:hypothetical protein
MGETLYECADCGLHYTDPETAAACYRHCTTHHACNLEITRHSVERRTAPPPLNPLAK